MTENLAGRGEGLAGLVAKWRRWAKVDSDPANGSAFQQGRGSGITACIDGLEALEAAAPPSTAPQFNKEEIDVLVQGFAGDTGWLTNHLNRLMSVKVAALATPSPQAPQQESSFSTTEQTPSSMATASGNLNAGVTCICYIERLGNFGNYKRWRDKNCPIHGEKEPAPAATQEQPAGSALTVGNVTGVLFNAGVGLTAPVAAKVTAELNAICGSPRKVGEDGASEALHHAIRLLKVLPKPIYKEYDDIRRECEELISWYHAEYGTASPPSARSSSVPVGEQKQEEGV